MVCPSLARMTLSHPQKSLVVALYVNAALLAGIVIILLTRDPGPSWLNAAWGQNQLPIGGGGGVFIVPAQFSDHSFGCYIMDIDSQTLCAYQYYEKQLRLVAARNFRHDRRLNQFNSDRPTPEEVRLMVEQEAQGGRVNDRPARTVNPED